MSESQSTSPSGLITLSTVLPIMCIFVVALRFWLRRKQEPSVKTDDWLMLPALIFFIGICICAIMGVNRRVWGYVTPYAEKKANPQAFNDDIVYEGQLLEAFQFIQIPALGCIKLSALFFYRRIFCVHGHRTAFDITTLLSIGTIVLWIISMTIMNGLQCGSNISALWSNASEYIADCGYSFPFETGFAISNFLLDLLIIIIPVPKVWSLHTSTPRKIAVTGVFGLALIGLAASTARMVIYLQIVANGPSLTADIRLEDTATIFWSNLEAGLSLLAVNLPSLWTIVNKTSPERILASLRGIISLRSSRASSQDREWPHTRIPEGVQSDKCDAGIAAKGARYELRSLEERGGVERV